MEQAVFMAMITIPLALIILIERRRLKTYITLGVFTVILAAIWEPIGVYSGIWFYNTQPQFLGVSVMTLIAYFHWVTFSYFLGNRVSGRMKR